MAKKQAASGPVTILTKKGGKFFANDALTLDRCRWPIGDPRDQDFHMCGNRHSLSGSYCEFHQKLSTKTSAAATETSKQFIAIKAA